MVSLYGHKWTSSYGDGDSGNIWFATLRDLTPDHIKVGLVRCTGSGEAWPPSAPEFKAMCLPTMKDYGIPEARESYIEASNASHNVLGHKWSHNAVYEAGRRSGWHGIKCGKISEKQFCVIYQAVCDEVVAGKNIIGPTIQENAIEHKSGGTKTKTEQAIAANKAAMAALRGEE